MYQFLTKKIYMNLLILLITIWVFSSSLTSSATVARPDPPTTSISDPLILTGKEPFAQISAEMGAHSPGVPEVKMVHHQELSKKIIIVFVVASSLLSGILLSLFCFWIYRQKKLKGSTSKSKQSQDAAKGLSLAPILGRFNSLRIAARKGSVAFIDYPLLAAATNNFQETNILSGHLYKARFECNLLAVVKKLHGRSQDAEREFDNEVDLLSKIRHQNIVLLLGYCIHREARFLVYEMMHNGSLESQLHGPSHGSALTWHLRMKIALDVARGLEFLHERCNPPMIHGYLNSSNILLDSEFRAKLSDFGLAIADGNQSTDDINLSGPLGYVAPEYFLDGKLTDKSDVYAFGVVLLELLMGRKPVERTTSAQCHSVVTWAMPQLTNRSKLPNILDPMIRNTMDLKHLYQVSAVAALCIQPEPSYRPLITDVLHSFIPLVPTKLGGSLRFPRTIQSACDYPSSGKNQGSRPKC